MPLVETSSGESPRSLATSSGRRSDCRPWIVARATIQGQQSLRRPDEVAKLRGLSDEEVSTKGMLAAYRERTRPKHEVTEVA